MSKNRVTRFFVNEAGQVEVLDFQKRTFKQALKPILKKGWKRDPVKLVAAMHRSSDLRDAVRVIRDAYLTHFEKLSDDLLARICNDTKTAQGVSEKASAAVDPALEESYQDLLAVTVLLSDIATKSLTNWVRTLSRADYGDLVEELRFFLLHDVTENFHAWDSTVDTPQGQAVTLILDLAPDDQDAFDFNLEETDDPLVPLRLVADKSVEELNAIAAEAGLDIEFRASRMEPVKPAKPEKPEKTEKPGKSVKSPTPVRKGARKAGAAKTSAPEATQKPAKASKAKSAKAKSTGAKEEKSAAA